MQNREYKYHLQVYKSPASKHICPNCGRKSLKYYVDSDNAPISEQVGRCDHESSCGYHYTPSQYFRDHPLDSLQADYEHPAKNYSVADWQDPKPLPPSYIAPEYMERTLHRESPLFGYLRQKLGAEAVDAALKACNVGATKDGSVIYWQVDTLCNIRTGKIIPYKADGHRDKRGRTDWVHSVLLRFHRVESYNLVQCLFGEHLLKQYPGKPVALVEAEKTAIVCSVTHPQFVWVAVGSLAQLNTYGKSLDKLKILQGRKIYAFPDADGYGHWCAKADVLRTHGFDITVVDYIERHATPEQKAHGADIADLILAEREAAPPPAYNPGLMAMMAQSPALQTLIDKLDLEEVL